MTGECIGIFLVEAPLGGHLSICSPLCYFTDALGTPDTPADYSPLALSPRRVSAYTAPQVAFSPQPPGVLLPSQPGHLEVQDVLYLRPGP